MVRIPTGSFLMGHKDDILAMPVHKVTIGKNIAMSKYEITFDDYDMFAQATNRALPSDNRWGRANRLWGKASRQSLLSVHSEWPIF